MTVYLDTSAATKLFVEEEYSSDVADLVIQEEAASSVLIPAELLAAIGVARREGRIASRDAEQLAEAALSFCDDLLKVPVAVDLCVSAGRLALHRALRGYDAMHLASALVLQFALSEPIMFATFDRNLWRAANDEGLHAWPPQYGG